MSAETLDDSEMFPRCPECGGDVKLVARTGRSREYLKGFHLTIPNDFGIPTCTDCGEESMSAEISEKLDEILSGVLQTRMRLYVEKIHAIHAGTSQREIEEALRVTPSYLSHVLSGRKPPSATLVELLALFAEVPGAFEHALPGRAAPSKVVAKTFIDMSVLSTVYVHHYQAKAFAGEIAEALPSPLQAFPNRTRYSSRFGEKVERREPVSVGQA